MMPMYPSLPLHKLKKKKQNKLTWRDDTEKTKNILLFQDHTLARPLNLNFQKLKQNQQNCEEVRRKNSSLKIFPLKVKVSIVRNF